MTFYRRLGEGLPERRAPPRDAFQVDPKALKRWIEALPLANASVAARMLFQAVRELNQMTIDPVGRLGALEALRVPVAALTDAIDRQIVGASFPLPPQKAQLGATARDFQRQMALGYRLAIYELCAPDGKVPFLRGKTVTLALERAIGHLGAELCKGYYLYAAPPEGVWRIINALFGFALSTRLDDKAVDDPVAGGSGTPRQTFAHVLLLAISNPYRLTQKEIHEAWQVTRAWSPLPVLRGAVPGESVFAVPLDEDRGPGYLPEERSSEGAARLSFDTAPLERELERQLALVDGLSGSLSFRSRGGAAVAVGADLVRRLVTNWRFVPERAQRRLPAGHELDTLVGLHAVHYFLAGGVDFETVVRRACGTVLHVTERERGSSWSASDVGRPELQRARVLDQSLGGYRIVWDRADAVRARVGELVALSAASGAADPAEVAHDERDWMVGVIRWLRITTAGAVDAGIEILGREARAAVVRSMDAYRHPRPSVRGVVLQAPRASGGHAAAVLAPTVLERNAPSYEFRAMPARWSAADVVEVRELGDIDVAEQTASFLRIQLPMVADGAEAETPADAASPA
ncbi:MAG: hypothetical protein LW860_10450 [Xanthomonadaceae bacterium]|jgi:hypothetical protein|nr:hypothetical protein [Xanthomonadaceae bacterium]